MFREGEAPAEPTCDVAWQEPRPPYTAFRIRSGLTVKFLFPKSLASSPNHV